MSPKQVSAEIHSAESTAGNEEASNVIKTTLTAESTAGKEQTGNVTETSDSRNPFHRIHRRWQGVLFYSAVVTAVLASISFLKLLSMNVFIISCSEKVMSV